MLQRTSLREREKERHRDPISDGAAAAAAKPLQSCPTLSDPRTATHQAPWSMGFSRQEYWSGVPLRSPMAWVAYPFSRGSSRPRNQTRSPALQADSLPTELSGSPVALLNPCVKVLTTSFVK